MSCLNGSRKLHFVQKILRVDVFTCLGPAYFLLEEQFFAGIGPAIFRIVRRAIEAHVSNPFSPPFLVIIGCCFRLV
jgi:hypothetical protein